MISAASSGMAATSDMLSLKRHDSSLVCKRTGLQFARHTDSMEACWQSGATGSMSAGARQEGACEQQGAYHPTIWAYQQHGGVSAIWCNREHVQQRACE
eukprot:1142733-Pelagomonas_calceolata.AAC.3